MKAIKLTLKLGSHFISSVIRRVYSSMRIAALSISVLTTHRGYTKSIMSP